MRLLLLLYLMGLSLAQNQNYLSIECPIPDDGTAIDETTCALYSACAWDIDSARCHMQKNDVAGYIVTSDPVDTGRGFTVDLVKADSVSLFDGDIINLQVEIIYHQADHLQVKITDSDNARYEVPVPLTLPETADPTQDYDVTVGNLGGPFVLNVTRKSTGKSVFISRGPLTYEDQFIQITTQLTSDYLYGIGESPHTTLKHSFDSRTTWPLFARDQQFVEKVVNEYGTHPYYVNIEDDEGNTHSVLFFNSNAMEYSTFSLEDGNPAVTIRTIGGIVDLHIFLGPDLEKISETYQTTVGLPELPPYWTLGFQLSKYGYGNDSNYLEVRDRMRAEGMPQDVQVFDIDYMDRQRDFTYDPVNWGLLPQIIQDLHAEDIKVVLIIDPAIAIDMDYPTYANGRASDVFIKWDDVGLVPSDQPADADTYVVGYVWPDNKTVFPDFFKPETVDWWTAELTTLHQVLEYDGIWIDMNEPANFGTNMDRPFNYPESEPDWSLKCPDNTLDNPPYPTRATTMDENESKRISDKTICMSTAQTDGINTYSHYDVHNLYGYREAMVTELALEDVFAGKRPAILSRSTFPGSSIGTAHWLGDNSATWSHLRDSIIGMIEFNLFGVPMVGADVCGFIGAPTEELCVRWMQLGALSPFYRNHNALGEPDQDPASPIWSQAGRDNFKKSLNLRYSLMPYFYSILHRGHMNGRTVIRPMFGTFPADLNTREINDQFMWYEELMVAPVVTEGATSRDVYFPEGLWYSIYDGALMSSGSETLTIDAPIDFIPVYLRSGHIIAHQAPSINTVETLKNDYTISIALDEQIMTATGELYMDDTVSYMSMSETYLATFTYDQNELTMTQNHDASILAGKLISYVNFYGFPREPSAMLLNSVSLDSSRWIYVSSTKVLEVYLDQDLSVDFILFISY